MKIIDNTFIFTIVKCMNIIGLECMNMLELEFTIVEYICIDYDYFLLCRYGRKGWKRKAR
jgi:hypothetical protein